MDNFNVDGVCRISNDADKLRKGNFNVRAEGETYANGYGSEYAFGLMR